MAAHCVFHAVQQSYSYVSYDSLYVFCNCDICSACVCLFRKSLCSGAAVHLVALVSGTSWVLSVGKLSCCALECTLRILICLYIFLALAYVSF